MWAVFEKIAKNLEKRPFLTLFGQYVRNEIENRKSGSVVRLLTTSSNFMQNFRKIHPANSSRPRVDGHTHFLTYETLLMQRTVSLLDARDLCISYHKKTEYVKETKEIFCSPWHEQKAIVTKTMPYINALYKDKRPLNWRSDARKLPLNIVNFKILPCGAGRGRASPSPIPSPAVTA